MRQHLLYQPRARGGATDALGAHACGAGRFALAVHARRGDKLTEARKAEAIAVPDEAATRFFSRPLGSSETNGVGSCHASRSGRAGLVLLGFYSGLRSHVGTDRQLKWHSGWG